MMVTTVFVGSRSLERTLLWCFREKSVTLKFPWFIITFSFKMGRPAHTGTASNPKLPTRSCQCDGWTMWCWELRGMSPTSFWHPCNSARRWTSICHFDVPLKNACLSCFSRFRLFCGTLLRFHSGIWWWTTWFGLPSFGPNPCGWLGTCFAHGVSVCPCSIVFQCRYSRTIQVNIKLFVFVCLTHGFVCFRFDFLAWMMAKFPGDCADSNTREVRFRYLPGRSMGCYRRRWLVGTLVKRALKKSTRHSCLLHHNHTTDSPQTFV